MKKTTDFCICENKDADQLRGNREADQRLCFRYTDSTIPLLPISEISSPIFCGCTARFVSDLVRTPEDRFSHNKAQLLFLVRDNGLSTTVSLFPRFSDDVFCCRISFSVFTVRSLFKIRSSGLLSIPLRTLWSKVGLFFRCSSGVPSWNTLFSMEVIAEAYIYLKILFSCAVSIKVRLKTVCSSID